MSKKPKITAKFGRLELAMVLSAFVFAGYFQLVLPLLPQDTETLQRLIPYAMGVGAALAVVGLALSCTAIVRVVQDSTNHRPLNTLRLLLGIVGIVAFTFSLFVITLVTTAFIIGTASLKN